MTVLEYRAQTEPGPVIVHGRSFDVARALRAGGGVLHVDDSEHPDLAHALDRHAGMTRRGLVTEWLAAEREQADLERERERLARRTVAEDEQATERRRESAAAVKAAHQRAEADRARQRLAREPVVLRQYSNPELERARQRDREHLQSGAARIQSAAADQRQRARSLRARTLQAMLAAPPAAVTDSPRTASEQAAQRDREHLRSVTARVQSAQVSRHQQARSARARRLADMLAAPAPGLTDPAPLPTIVYGLQPGIDFEPFVGATTTYPDGQLTEDVYEDLFATSWRGVALSDGPVGIWVLNEVNVQNEAHNLVLSIPGIAGSLIGRARMPFALGARAGLTLGQRGIFTGSFTLTTPGALVGTRRMPVPLGVGGQQLAMGQPGLLPGDADPCVRLTRGGTVVIPYVPALNSAQFTYEARFAQTLATPVNQTLMSTIAANRGVSWGTVGSELFATLGTGSSTITVTSSGAGIGTAPVHGAVSYNGANVRFYVNGLLVTAAAVSGYAPQTAGPLTWGAGPSGLAFDGRVHAAAAYNNTLTAARVAAHAAAFPAASAVQDTPVEIGLAAFPTLLRRVA